MEQQHYVLRGGEQGAERLRLLAAVTWPTTQALLLRVGLRQGLHCLDVGCGNGAVALKMAEVVGDTGRVVGVDADRRCLEVARHEANRTKSTVEFKDASVSELGELSSFDLAYARFLLTHLPDPNQALEQMTHAVKPEGTVVVEDIQFTGHFCYPACPAFERYVELYQEVVVRKGGDPNIGPRLPNMFLDAGLDDVEFEVIQPVFRKGLGKLIAPVTLEHIRESVVDCGLASNEEITKCVAELESFARDPRTILSMPRIVQVSGKA
jgi:ubiquinone/menaquinone biosynthesis C-methylase UbiE